MRTSEIIEQPLLDVETNGIWANVVVPGDYSSNEGALNSVACLTSGTCIAVGSDGVVGATPNSLMVQETDGALDSGGAVAGTGLSSVACTTVTQLCVAGGNSGGTYGTSGNPPVPMALVETAPGQWETAKPTIAGWQSSSFGFIGGVACGPTTCAGIGGGALQEPDASNYKVDSAFLFSDLNGSSSTTVFPDSVGGGLMSCPSDGNCLASNTKGLMYTETDGTWTQSDEPPAPGGGSPSSAILYSLYCFAVGKCLGTGSYDSQTMGAAFYDNRGTWTAVEIPSTDTIAFNSGGGAAVASLTGPDGSSITLPSDTYTGYTFNGWFTL